MLVKELIQELEAQDPEAEVLGREINSDDDPVLLSLDAIVAEGKKITLIDVGAEYKLDGEPWQKR
jgi:hypothetical protein